ncbi:MAG: hypothetical protein ACTHU0_19930 [Kofleriaceae bacterium]
MTQYRYWSKGMQASADLKQVQRRVRAARPELFAPREVRESTMDGEGKVTVATRRHVDALGVPPARRHAIWTKA